MTDVPKGPIPRLMDPNADNKSRMKKALSHEGRFATALSGRRLPRSGGVMWGKTRCQDKNTDNGDLANASFHVEHKSTRRASLGVKLSWFGKLRAGAKRVAKWPAFAFTFETERGNPIEDWVAVPLDIFVLLCERAQVEARSDDG